jgi:hypothetical protein
MLFQEASIFPPFPFDYTDPASVIVKKATATTTTTTKRKRKKAKATGGRGGEDPKSLLRLGCVTHISLLQ